MRTNMNYLVLGDYLFDKQKQKILFDMEVIQEFGLD
ncbi:MAG: hypothetical protein KAT31_08785 [Bacteroidales bacterium]|nr:hypothetical protein [Bacteroidales bacterium]